MVRVSAGTVSLLAVLVALGSTASSLTSGDDMQPSAEGEAAMIRSLFEQVEAHREEVFSAKIVYRWHIAAYRRAENTPDRVHALLDQYDLIGDPESLRDLVNTLVPDPATIDPPWEIRTFHMLGDKRRADSSRNLIQLVDDENEMTYQGFNEQLTIDTRGKSSIHLTDITDFRSYPTSPPYGLKAEDFRVVDHTDGQIRLEMIPPEGAGKDVIPYRYTFDRATGVMTHSSTYARGKLYREVWQLALTEYPGGIIMPALRIATLYREGRLSALRVFIIEEAEFNGPVPEELFIMPVAEGTVIVDHRHQEKSILSVRQPTDDVRSILVPVRISAGSLPGSLSNEPRRGWRMLLILNGVAFIVLATVLWRKASRSPVQQTSGKSLRSGSS